LDGKTVFLTVARMVPRKGHRIALQAFATVSAQFPDAHYLIVGTGPEEGNLRALAERLRIRDRVTFVGFVPSEMLAALYNLCDVMVLINRQEADGDIEGFGIVFLEANASGKPVIGGRSGGAIEAIVDGSTGFLVAPDDVVGVESAMRRLLTDLNLRGIMGGTAACRARDEFSWTERARMLQLLNNKIVGRNCQHSTPEPCRDISS
jgi:phosphatidylinositol alpha-1,6-mannosyltransferase